MEPKPLPDEAEQIRKEIKEMVPETASKPPEVQAELIHKDNNGNKRYGGGLLEGKISRLKEILKIEEVSVSVDFSEHLIDCTQHWDGRLRYWSKPTKLVNDRKEGYLIPLSDDINVNPGGKLQGGWYIQVTNEPILSSGAAAIFIVP